MSIVLVLQSILEPIFPEDSYGYRPNRSAYQALERARKRCWQFDWVPDLDVSKFFDTIDHELLMKAVKRQPAKDGSCFILKDGLRFLTKTKTSIASCVHKVFRKAPLSVLSLRTFTCIMSLTIG
jgi:RNA-directed DNA polymerase